MAYVISDDCVACGTCIDECPVGAISEGDKYSINPDMCTECGTISIQSTLTCVQSAELALTHARLRLFIRQSNRSASVSSFGKRKSGYQF